MRPIDIIVTSSKGDNFKVTNVELIRSAKTGEFNSLIIRSRPENSVTFDGILRDRNIYMENVEVVDVGF